MRTTDPQRVMALLAAVLLAACRASDRLPRDRTIEPTVPPVAYTAVTAPTPVAGDNLILSETSFTEMGLVWRECQVSQAGYTDWQQAEVCFGRAAPSWSAEEEARSARRTKRGLRLTVGDDVFEVRDHDVNVVRWSTLSKNGWPLRVLVGGALVHSPNISLRDISGKIAWEFAGELQKTVVYGGKDARTTYDLDAAYRPYEIGEKLIFVGQKDGDRFVVYDGERIGPPFDEIIVAYCCEPAAYSVRFGGGRYAFWGTRGDARYVVEVSAG